MKRSVIYVSVAVLVFALGVIVRLGLNIPNSWGASVGTIALVAVPVLVGCLIGFGRPYDPVESCTKTMALCLLVVAPLMGEGFFCILFLMPIALVLSLPFAAAIGYAVRRDKARSARNITTSGLLLAIGVSLVPSNKTNVLADSVEIDAPPEQVWASIDRTFMHFNAEGLPWAMKLGFPLPTQLVGEGVHVGSVRRVVFDNGTVVARVVASEAPKEFVLNLSYENPGREFFDHWVTLDRTVFSFERLPAGRTRLTHTTRYQRLLGPGFLIQPIEEYFGHKLQAYLLEDWAAASQRNGMQPVATR